MMTSVDSGRAYDAIADHYDDYWTRHVLSQHARMTRDLGLRRGERLVDVAAGAGTTVDMLRLTAPAPGVAVDPSAAMLARCRARAESEGFALEGRCETAQEFLSTCEQESFDVLSLRFGLAYLDWRTELGSLARPVRRGTGRVGILTNLSSSAPQALKTYHAFMDMLGMEKANPPVPDDTETIASLLAEGGLVTQTQWTERLRVWFSDGLAVCDWILKSGYITGDALQNFPPELLAELKPVFAAKLEEGFREERGVPLDFDIGCVIAVREK
jgi:ubiquinone/menaquinone biosynthesis C-methylase UbiE